MLNVRYIVLSLLIIFANILSQINPGSRQIALANSDVALSNDVFSIFNNPAGLAQIKWTEIGIYYSPSPFGIKELANGYGAVTHNFNFGTIAAGFSFYGFELYKEHKLSLSYANNYKQFYFGISVFYNTIEIEKYGNDNSFSLNLGGLTYVSNYFRIGFSVHNINQATFGSEEDQIPTIFSAGVSYDVLSNLTLNSSIEKELEYDFSLRTGIEYDIIKYLSLRVGFNNYPSTYTAGVGINFLFFNLDYAVFTHEYLGLTHQAGLIIHFGDETPRSQKVKSFIND
jgi:hypothetical protein